MWEPYKNIALLRVFNSPLSSKEPYNNLEHYKNNALLRKRTRYTIRSTHESYRVLKSPTKKIFFTRDIYIYMYMYINIYMKISCKENNILYKRYIYIYLYIHIYSLQDKSRYIL